MRTTGRSDEVVDLVLKSPNLFSELIGGMQSASPGIRMRSADAVEKISTHRPDLLQPYKTILLDEIAPIDQQEVRWHVCQLISRLQMIPSERRKAAGVLYGYLEDKSRIVKTFAMQALADIALQDNELKESIVRVIEELAQTGSPAMQSRGRKLLIKLRKVPP